MAFNPQGVQRSIDHWTRILSLFGTGIRTVTVRSGEVLELTDDFFDAPDTGASASEWFQIPGGSCEVFLDDDVTTLRLANRDVLQKLHGSEAHPLVHWFGYKAESYDLVLQATEGEVFQPAVPDVTRLAWIAWDYRYWRTFLFDGGRLMPVTQSKALADGLERDPNRVTWMGWDGENLDVFTSDSLPLPPEMVAVFAGKDGGLLAVNRALK